MQAKNYLLSLKSEIARCVRRIDEHIAELDAARDTCLGDDPWPCDAVNGHRNAAARRASLDLSRELSRYRNTPMSQLKK